MAHRLKDLGPAVFPGFIYQWMSLITHRIFVSSIFQVANEAGWAPYTALLVQMLTYGGEILKPAVMMPATETLFHGMAKLLLGLQHDYPAYFEAAKTCRQCKPRRLPLS